MLDQKKLLVALFARWERLWLLLFGDVFIL